MKEYKGLKSSELGGQISLGQWFFRLALIPSWVILVVWAGLCPAGTRRDIPRQQAPSRASPRCQGPLCSAWHGPSAPVSKKWGGMTSPLLEMTPRTKTEATYMVFLSGRSDISLLSILVLVQNFLQTVNQGPVHF